MLDKINDEDVRNSVLMVLAMYTTGPRSEEPFKFASVDHRTTYERYTQEVVPLCTDILSSNENEGSLTMEQEKSLAQLEDDNRRQLLRQLAWTTTRETFNFAVRTDQELYDELYAQYKPYLSPGGIAGLTILGLFIVLLVCGITIVNS
jgi:hypothetical protein